jgi:DNA modification methylase
MMQIRNRVKELRSVKASELLPHPENWRQHPPAQRRAIEAVLGEIGYADAILARETPDGLQILDGHLRAETTPDTEVPVLVVDLDDDEARKLLLTLDPLAAMAQADAEAFKTLADMASFDTDILKQLVSSIATNGLPTLELPETPKEETHDIGEAMAAAEAPDYVATVQRGQVWQLGEHRLMCGDATSPGDVAGLLQNAEPALMVTDPPYGVVYTPAWRDEAAARGQLSKANRRTGQVTGDDRADWSSAWRLFPGAVVYCWSAAGAPQVVSGKALEDAGFEIRAGLVWRKPHFPVSRGHYTFQHEPCWYAVKRGSTAAWAGDKSASSVWDIPLDRNVSPGASDGGLGAQKPLECMERPIRNHEGDVYEPFVGSGTTIIAAERQGRRCYAMDIEPRYCDVTIRRWEDYTGQKAVLIG